MNTFDDKNSIVHAIVNDAHGWILMVWRKEKFIEKLKQRWLNFWLILEGSNKGVKKIGLHHTPYATLPEFHTTSMGIIFYILYHATVTL